MRNSDGSVLAKENQSTAYPLLAVPDCGYETKRIGILLRHFHFLSLFPAHLGAHPYPWKRFAFLHASRHTVIPKLGVVADVPFPIYIVTKCVDLRDGLVPSEAVKCLP